MWIKVTTMKTLAERLTWARIDREMSQQQLADKAGVAQSTIGSLEAGTRMTARKITAIAAALGVSSDWLADGKGDADAIRTQAAPTAAPEGTRKLQWLDEAESEVLSLYRACGKAEQATALVILRSLPKAFADDKRADQA